MLKAEQDQPPGNPLAPCTFFASTIREIDRGSLKSKEPIEMCGPYTRNGASFPGGAVAIIHPSVNDAKAFEGIRGHVYFSTPTNNRTRTTATVVIMDSQRLISTGQKMSEVRIVMQ